jgi:hypothetical protein
VNILFLNNYHYLRGGSEQVFFDELQLLKQHGHTTAAFARKHTENSTSKYEELFPNDIRTDKVHFSANAFRTLREVFYSGEAKRSLRTLLTRYCARIIKC